MVDLILIYIINIFKIHLPFFKKYLKLFHLFLYQMFSVIINTCTCMFKGNYQKVIDILSLLGLYVEISPYK